MLRSFLTRLPNSLIGVVLLVPCLLIGLACATTFPIESLEKGMTAETVRENFGAPEAIETTRVSCATWPPAINTCIVVDSSWKYPHEEQHWPMLLFPPLLMGGIMSIPYRLHCPESHGMTPSRGIQR